MWIWDAIEQALGAKRITQSQANAPTHDRRAAGQRAHPSGRASRQVTERLKKYEDARKQMASSISSSIQGELDLGSLVTTTEPNAFGFGGGKTGTTFGAIAAAVPSLAAQAKRFANKLRALPKAGITKDSSREPPVLAASRA